jgi:hypothetical protein
LSVMGGNLAKVAGAGAMHRKGTSRAIMNQRVAHDLAMAVLAAVFADRTRQRISHHERHPETETVAQGPVSVECYAQLAAALRLTP